MGLIVSQEMFESCVAEAMEELELSAEEARTCAAEQLRAQGLDLRSVDLSGEWASRRAALEAALAERGDGWARVVADACRGGPEALRNRPVEVAGLELVKLSGGLGDEAVAAAEVLAGGSSASIVDAFGPELGRAVCAGGSAALDAAAACAAGREGVKVDLLKTAGFVEAVVAALPASSGVLRATCAADDPRAKASGAFEACRKYVEAGAAKKLVDADDLEALRVLCKGETQCKAIAAAGGLERALRALKAERRAEALGLVRNLAHSDDLKSKIDLAAVAEAIEEASMSRDALSCERALAVVASTCLRRPDLAERAADPELFQNVFARFPDEPRLLRQACLCVRNLVARNPDHVPLFKPLGEDLYAAAAKHPQDVLDVAYAALRDLGFNVKMTRTNEEAGPSNFRPVFEESEAIQDKLAQHADVEDALRTGGALL